VTFLGISLLWWVLLGSFGLAALLAIVWVAAMDRNNPPRIQTIGTDILAPLPVAHVHAPTAVRRSRRSTKR